MSRASSCGPQVLQLRGETVNIKGDNLRLLFSLIMPALVLILAGCGGTMASEGGQNPVGPASLQVVSQQGEDVSPSGDSPAGALDTDAIVAAQEEVVNRIYNDHLSSVVHIRVTEKVVSTGRVPESGVPFDLPFGFEPPPTGPSAPREFYRRGEGSGFVWSNEGHIVTNQHVVADADKVMVIFSDGTEVEAEVIGGDPDSDLAVLKVNVPPEKLRPVVPGDSDAVKVGQLAVAIGNPFGQEFTVTSGIVSAVGRTIRSGSSPFSIPEVIQTDAAINPGNSGGPLLDRKGKVIGINTMIISRSGGSAGVGFAVPINTATRIVPELISEGRYEYAWLGISGVTLRSEVASLMDLPGETRGAQVIEIAKDGPADIAELKGSDKTSPMDGQDVPLGGDVIIAIDDHPIKEMDDLIAFLTENTRPGDTVTLDAVREGGERLRVEVTLGSRPQIDGG